MHDVGAAEEGVCVGEPGADVTAGAERAINLEGLVCVVSTSLGKIWDCLPLRHKHWEK